MLRTPATLAPLLALCWAGPELAAEAGPRVSLRKCCGEGEVLDSRLRCVAAGAGRGEQQSSLLVNVTNMSDKQSQEHPVQLHTSQPLPCVGEEIYFKFTIWAFGDSLYLVDTFTNEPSTLDSACVEVAGAGPGGGEPQLLARRCATCPPGQPCLNLCCAGGLVLADSACVAPDPGTTAATLPGNYTGLTTELLCGPHQIFQYKSDLWSVSSRGAVIDGAEYSLNKYCIDPAERVARVCHDQEEDDLRKTAKIVVMSVSIVCIVLIIIINCSVEELRTNHVTAIKIPFFFFLALSFAIVVVSSSFHDVFVNSSSCIVLGLLLQFSALSIFFWLTCLSVDVWLRFRKIQDFSAAEVSRNHLYYTLSILGPATITLITLVLQFAADPDTANYIHPRIGEESCQLGKYQPQFLYFHLIIIILLGCDLILFLAMVQVLSKGPWKLCGNSNCAPPSVSVIQTYRIFVELFFLMGVNWISESASFFLNWQQPEVWRHPVLTVLETINWSVGIILLLLFLCKRSNRLLLADLLAPGVESDAVTLRTYSSQLSTDTLSRPDKLGHLSRDP